MIKEALESYVRTPGKEEEVITALRTTYCHLFGANPDERDLTLWRKELVKHKSELRFRMRDLVIHCFWEDDGWEVLLSPNADSFIFAIWQTLKGTQDD